MTALVLIAQIKAKPDKVRDVEHVLRGLLAPTRAEEGCLAYDLHTDNEDASRFVLIETWASIPLWQAHMQSPHLKMFQAQTDDLVEEWKLLQLTKIA